jgi:hypothetical protein
MTLPASGAGSAITGVAARAHPRYWMNTPHETPVASDWSG